MTSASEQVVAKALGSVVRDHGWLVASHPGRLRGTLNDVLGGDSEECRGLVDAVVVSAEEGIPARIRSARSETLGEVTPELVAQLEEWGFSREWAAWVVQAWITLLHPSPTVQPPVTAGLDEALTPPETALPDRVPMREPVHEVHRGRPTWVGVAATAAAVVIVAAGVTSAIAMLGNDGDAGGDGASSLASSWTFGTTEKASTLDPAGGYTLGEWTLMYSMYQTLLFTPTDGGEPQGDAAEACEYHSPQILTCTLRSGLQFGNGNDLTSSDVKFSLERNITIANPNGSAYLLSSISAQEDGRFVVDEGAIETPDDQTVIFHLNQPDTTFRFVLTTPAAAIVDEDTFPADELIANDEAVGSGPFVVDQFDEGRQALLTANEEHHGLRAARTERLMVSYYEEPAQLKQAVENGDVDVAWFSPISSDVNDLKDSDVAELVEGKGSVTRYWVWQFGTQAGKQKAVRQAVAELIDREAIADRVYGGTVYPLYSIIPPGLAGQTDAFQDEYGENSVDDARSLLEGAGTQIPVHLTLGYNVESSQAAEEANEFARQLDASGLFDVETKSAEGLSQMAELFEQNLLDLVLIGWIPDYLDADSYLSSIDAYSNNYSNPRADELVAAERAIVDPAERERIFTELQRLVAEDVPLIPSWVGRNVALTGPSMNGVDETLDPSLDRKSVV